MKDPLKQGLKQKNTDKITEKARKSWSERSIKTRIETFWSFEDESLHEIVEVKDPLKQGLKHTEKPKLKFFDQVEVKDPLKQGLKHITINTIGTLN